MITRLSALALASQLVVSSALAQSPTWAALWNPLMPAAVYDDGTAFIISQVPLQSWPWASLSLSRGLLSVWLKPGPKDGSALPLRNRIFSIFETIPTGYDPNIFHPDNILAQVSAAGDDSKPPHYDLWSYFASSVTPSCSLSVPGGPHGTDCVTFWTPHYPVFTAGSGWVHVIAGWDTTTLTFHAFVNDRDLEFVPNKAVCAESLDGCPFAVPTAAVEFINFLISQASESNAYIGGVSELWLHFGTFHDPKDPAVRAKFRDPTGHQVYLGPYGDIPFGFSPDFYFSAEAVGSQWGCNVTGPPTHVVGNLPRIPGPNAMITVGSDGWIPGWPTPLPRWPHAGKPLGNC